jgi:hypothetical protein
MTPQEFFEAYEGCEVRIVKWANRPEYLGRIGIVRSFVRKCVIVAFNPGLVDNHWKDDERYFTLDEIELVEIRDNTPLPLPG